MNDTPNKFDNKKVAVREMLGKGRGVVAAQDIAAGELIVSAPVFVLAGSEYDVIRMMPCIMHTFLWERPESEGGESAAIAFGLASLCNYAEENANADAVRVYDEECLDLVALRPIGVGEEILIRYASVPFEPV